MAAELHIFAVPGIPDVTPGAELGALLAESVTRAGRAIEAGDVFVIAQKIVSKAEGALVRLDEVVPSPLAEQWAAAHGKDPRVVEVIFRESRRIVRMDRGILIAEIVMRKTARTPVAVVRGAAEWSGEGSGRMLVRDAGRDLFR